MSAEPFRSLSDFERRLIDRLLEEDFPGRDVISKQANEMLVRQLDDHGCLGFEVNIGIKADVKDRVPTEGEIEDVDGVTIHILLHVVDGKICELEIYKDDSSSVIQMPDPTELRLFHPK